MKDFFLNLIRYIFLQKSSCGPINIISAQKVNKLKVTKGHILLFKNPLSLRYIFGYASIYINLNFSMSLFFMYFIFGNNFSS